VARARAIARRSTLGPTVPLLLLLACGGGPSGPDGGGGGGGDETATVSGTVREAATAAALADATVSIGGQQATSDGDGRFELTEVPVGTATLKATRSGYVPVEEAVTLTAGANAHDITLTPQEVYVAGTTAAYVPSGVGTLRGAIVVLGGPDASGFVTGQSITGGTSDLEASLQSLGAALRSLARSQKVALLGSKTTGMANTALNDNGLLGGLGTVAQQSGHAELAEAPVLMFGLSGGCPEASGLVSRHPDRAIGLLVRVPENVTRLTTAAALAVPTFVMQAELDEVVANSVVAATVAVNRSGGGLWALAVEPGVGHSVATATGNAAALGWIVNALSLRLPATPGDPLVALDEASGWLGDPTTFEITPWADYAGDRSKASWLLSQTAAALWQNLGSPPDDDPT
jgi:hypothetical protein